MLNDNDIFFDMEVFAEEVIYIPHGGTAKTVRGVIVRDEAEESRESGLKTGRLTFSIHLPEDDTYGITAVHVSKDKIQVPIFPGGSPMDMTVTKVLDHQHYVWTLEIAK